MHSTGIRDAFGRKIEFHNDTQITAMGGLCAAAQHLHRCGVISQLFKRLEAVLPDRGQAGKVRYSAAQLVLLRLFALMAGKEDLNDVPTLSGDPGFTMAIGRKDLPSTATLCRFERKIGEDVIDAGNQFLLDMYFRYGYKRKYVYIDVDNTPVPLHGHQEFVKFNGHYGCNCYLPLLAFIDGFPVAVFNGNEDGRKVMVKQFRAIVERIRERSPKSIIILRADSGFNGKALIDLCDELGCYYIIGLAPNAKLKAMLCDMDPEFVDVLRRPPQVGGNLLRHYGEIDQYTANSWSGPRRVIVRDYWDDERREWDPRFIQTNIPRESDGRCGKLWRLTAHDLYDQVYCQRGMAEKYNQEFKAQAFGARASSTRFLTNSYRMLLGAICQLFYRILRSCFFTKQSAWRSAGLTSFRKAFVSVAALVIELKSKVKIHINCGQNQEDSYRFWNVSPS